MRLSSGCSEHRRARAFTNACEPHRVSVAHTHTPPEYVVGASVRCVVCVPYRAGSMWGRALEPLLLEALRRAKRKRKKGMGKGEGGETLKPNVLPAARRGRRRPWC
eukprot:6185627-Pleurochrysis_carterae.AAC.2